MSQEVAPQIIVALNGPYKVSGSVPLTRQTITPNAGGESWEWTEDETFPAKEQYSLCRCGKSGNAPYCDGTHAKIAFNGTETARQEPFAQQMTVLSGPGLVLEDARPLCAGARFCDAIKDTWASMPETDAPDVRARVIHQVTHCPSGRLVVRDTATGEVIEPRLEVSIGIVEDSAEQASGPLWIRGGIAVQAADGTQYEVRNRVTLCRCGRSSNKPFCDGTHLEGKYKDGLEA